MISTLQGPIINNINNGEMNAIRAMPQKDITSDNESSFEMSRNIYTRTFPTGGTSNYMNGKKWYGNRDASQVTTNRRTNQVGVGSLNASNGYMGFTTHSDINTTRDALRRVRAGGAVAPAKKGANRNNAPVPSFSPAMPNLKKNFGIKQPYLFH
jgi:hypothetical protein